MTHDDYAVPTTIDSDDKAIEAMLLEILNMCTQFGSMAEDLLGVPLSKRRILTRAIRRQQAARGREILEAQRNEVGL